MDQMPLREIRVLDFSRLLPGPYCSWILGCFGAEVIRIEPLQGGDWLRETGRIDESLGWLFQSLNRGKKSIALDLKQKSGREIMFSLVETADVLFDTFRPGVMERLGLGYNRLSEINPRLVYCSLSGYGSQGAYRDRVGHDLNYIGLSGLLDLTGQTDGPPSIPATQIADIMGGMWAALGILLALHNRERTGKGMRVEGSMLGAAFASLPMPLSRSVVGEPQCRGAGLLTGGVLCYNVYETKDHEFMTLAALEPRFWDNFCKMVDKQHLLGEQFAKAASGESAYEELCAVFGSKSLLEWVEFFENSEVCCEPVYTIDQALSNEPIRSLGMMSEMGLFPPIQVPVEYVSTQNPAPELGEHNEELLADLGYKTQEIENFRAKGVI